MANEGIYYEAKQVANAAVNDLQLFIDSAQAQLEAAVPGTRTLDDSAFLGYVTALAKQYPREPILCPDGKLRFESPAILAWKHIPDSVDEYNRYVKIFGEPPVIDEV